MTVSPHLIVWIAWHAPPRTQYVMPVQSGSSQSTSPSRSSSRPFVHTSAGGAVHAASLASARPLQSLSQRSPHVSLPPHEIGRTRPPIVPCDPVIASRAALPDSDVIAPAPGHAIVVQRAPS